MLTLMFLICIACTGCQYQEPYDWKQVPPRAGAYDGGSAQELRGIRLELDRLNANIEKYLEVKANEK